MRVEYPSLVASCAERDRFLITDAPDPGVAPDPGELSQSWTTTTLRVIRSPPADSTAK